MDTQDSREQLKIWQRVRGELPITDGLTALAARALSQGALYEALSRKMQGPGRTILLQLRDAQLENARCIKGIYRMIAGTFMKVTAVPPDTQNLENALRKSYGYSLKALNAYQAKASHDEYGAIFQCLVEKERINCCKIAELMGLLGG